ncbi:BCL2/adenovirus E1B 19 kDa protein-interacting protein 3 isoform X2 [Anthonomus grandis grandis]|uniref:BCL2/adenovirus E1B 19 kDa protein-interacting protein 3 isoform X2 n=1 Tax=Anthonomus grandis grandis TaxID=2921223 RepID=UPI002166302B|nr:BCL2/adenovirus E1B 19 kDa protein-interacting protein 3 isoform X2 [Anthonomus grandis grandis]
MDCSESWVEIGGQSQGGSTPASVTKQLTVEDYLRLLREAQESNHSSCGDSLRDSPKSPPNSPVVQGSGLQLEWQSYYLNSESREDLTTIDWSSRPDSLPPKQWSFRSSDKYDMFSLRHAKIGSTPLFSKRGLCIIFLSNLFSMLFGTGVGILINRHGLSLSNPAIKFR